MPVSKITHTDRNNDWPTSAHCLATESVLLFPKSVTFRDIDWRAEAARRFYPTTKLKEDPQRQIANQGTTGFLGNYMGDTAPLLLQSVTRRIKEIFFFRIITRYFVTLYVGWFSALHFRKSYYVFKSLTIYISLQRALHRY